jgi:GntR family transcriptional regulator
VLDAASPIPLYHQLAEELFADIRAGTYPPGEKIPSEHELAARYGVGRPTVRQATDSLIQRGLLTRRRGSGTYVRQVPAQVDLFSLAGTLVSFESSGVTLHATLLGKPRLHVVDEAGHALYGREAIRVERLSSAHDEPVLLEELDFDAARFPGLVRMKLAGRSLSEVVETEFRMRPLAADQSFRAARIDAVRAAHLGLRPRTPVLRVDRTLHFPLADAAIHARMFCREGRFVFSQRIGGLGGGR